MDRTRTRTINIILFYFSFQIFCVVSALSSIPGNETDKFSLLEFKAQIEGDPLRSWNDSIQFCSWPGVTCSRRHHHRVTRLHLPSLSLKGRLSPHIGNLSFLRYLNLSHNSFSHKLPQEIGRLSRLEVLLLRNNSFSGEIPAKITRCSSLWGISLSMNSVSGTIPKDIGSLWRLQQLDLGVNKLAGEIPPSIGNLSMLVGLYLRNNELTGAVPESLGQLKRVQIVTIGRNSLTGSLPVALFNVSTLGHFSVHNNQLEGSLPPDLGHTLPNLQIFYFHTNNFRGKIPATLSNASNLRIFQILKNNFFGDIPSFASSQNMEQFEMSFNHLGYAKSGDLDFLRSLINCTNLETILISDNNLGGEIPETIGNMTSTRLRLMEFGWNQFTGSIPDGIGNLVHLDTLRLEVNRLVGSIPNTFGKLRNMKSINFDTNSLSGNIPSILGNLTLLITLFLGRNNLVGSIPRSLGQCKNLQQLSLTRNNLTGLIPPDLLSLSSLSIYLDLSENQLSGSIPMEVGRLVSLGNLDISENKLSGEIPKAFGSCTSLVYLSLKGNYLRGSIPQELKTLRGLEVLDLSHNNLSGKIPIYFADFRGLLYLNLSINELEGQVPLQGIFKNASKFSVVGNAKLCGGLPELKLPKCASENQKLSQKTKLAIIVPCAVVGLIMALILVKLLFLSRKRRSKTMLETSLGISLPRVSYGDLSQSTDNFSSANLIGAGSFGSVYKGILNQEGTLVAVKVLKLDVSRALKSFVAECETLRLLRHRNLVKLLTVCSSIDFKGNDFKALVYKFMENGNLEEWLHSNRSGQGQSRHLNLIQRVNIAIDVASALDYLHNHGPHESIVHCDIKPSNILLDDQMVAHVGDFGLAKLLRSAISSTFSYQTSSTGVRGTIGYVAPEYATGSEVSTLGDTYSFGVLLLEMFTGKRPTDSMFKDDLNLNSYATMALPYHISEILEPMLFDNDEEKQIRGFDDQDQVVFKSLVSIIKIGVACSSKSPGERRNISDVASELCKIRDVLGAHEMD